MSRLNQTEPATFSIMLCWTFFWDSVFSLFYSIEEGSHGKIENAAAGGID
jgi:hypothetical protein